MVGLIPKLLIDLIESLGGSKTVSAVKKRAEVPDDRVYHMNSVYDDAEWQRLLSATLQVLDLSVDDGIKAYADYFYQDSLKRWPMWFQMSGTAREFLLRQPKIHNGFATGVSDAAERAAIEDKFNIVESDNYLEITYRSPNRLCKLYKELAYRILNHFGEEAEVSELKCQGDGYDHCIIRVQWN